MYNLENQIFKFYYNRTPSDNINHINKCYDTIIYLLEIEDYLQYINRLSHVHKQQIQLSIRALWQDIQYTSGLYLYY